MRPVLNNRRVRKTATAVTVVMKMNPVVEMGTLRKTVLTLRYFEPCFWRKCSFAVLAILAFNAFLFLQELDMGSTFVSKAADIARRKLEQKPEKKKSPVKEEAKTSQDKVFTEIGTGDKVRTTIFFLLLEHNKVTPT